MLSSYSLNLYHSTLLTPSIPLSWSLCMSLSVPVCLAVQLSVCLSLSHVCSRSLQRPRLMATLTMESYHNVYCVANVAKQLEIMLPLK